MTKQPKALRGGLEKGDAKATPKASRRKRADTKKRQELFVRAATPALANDIVADREPYPADLMPLSKARTLDADPKTLENYNPTGERGEHRHTSPLAVAWEDQNDSLTPSRAKHESRFWPSSAGSVASIREVLRGHTPS